MWYLIIFLQNEGDKFMCDACEIYTFDNLLDVENLVKDFAKACKILLDRGVTKFIIRTQNGCSNLCGEILKQFIFNDNLIKIDFEQREYDPNNIKGYVLLFNYLGTVAMYDRSIMPTLLSKNFTQAGVFVNDFSNIEIKE